MLDFIISCVIFSILLIMLLSVVKKIENFSLDRMANEASDPIWLHYQGNNRDVLGESHRDYWLRNRLANDQGLQKLSGDTMFYNPTNYGDMPKNFKPKTLMAQQVD